MPAGYRKHGDLLSERPKLGKGIFYSPPITPVDLNIGKGLDLNLTYTLSGDQRKLIHTGDVSAKRSDKNRKVLSKRDQIPERIQHLVDDLALLADSQYMTEDVWEQGVADLSKASSGRNLPEKIDNATGERPIKDLIEESEKESEEKYYESPYESPVDWWEDLIDITRTNWDLRDDMVLTGSSTTSKEAVFGFELGSTLKRLQPDNEGFVSDVGIIWGFILGFLGRPEEEIGEEKAELQNLIEEIQTRHETRRKGVKRMPSDFDTSEIALWHNEHVIQGVEEVGISPHPIVLREVHHHQATTAEDGDLHRREAKQKTAKIAEVTPLREVDEIAQQVSSDIEVINNRSVPGIKSVRKVLDTLREIKESPRKVENEESDQENNAGSDDKESKNSESDQESGDKSDDEVEGPTTPTSENVDKEIGKKQLEDQVSAILNSISDEKHDEMYTTKPITKKKESRRDEWEFTPYGTVVCHTAFERDDKIEWIYRYAIGPEELSLHERKLVTNALDDLGFIQA